MEIFDTGDRDVLKWLAVDLDGTLAETAFPKKGIGPPIWKNIDKVHAAHRAGWKIVIHTSRGWADYELIERWGMVLGIPIDKIVCGKLLALRYIDDRNVDINAESWIP